MSVAPEINNQNDGDSSSWFFIIERFEQAWQSGTVPAIDDYLQLGGAARMEVLAELIAVDQERRYKSGTGQPLETYLERFPELTTHRDAVLELIAAEYELGRRLGWTITPETYCRRFPSYATPIRERLSAVVDFPTNLAPQADVLPAAHRASASGMEENAAIPSRLGRYQILARIGAGTFGIVYKGYDEQLQRDVAIKVPHRHWVASPAHVDAYLAEARILAQLDHPGIVPVHDFGRTQEGLCYLVSKFVDGTNLDERIQQGKPTYAESAHIVMRVAEALHHAHQKGLVHRDVKPPNILLDRDGKPVVVDFGLALREQDFNLHRGFAGTPAYASPEQAGCEGHRVGPRSDVFSLGVVFYELLTGQRPFRGRSNAEALEQVRSLEPPPPRQLDNRIPVELDRICLKALSKRVSDRYSIALDLADELRDWQKRDESRTTTKIVQVLVAPSLEQVLLPVAAPGSAANQLAVADTCRTPARVSPRGLRSFETEDADFFLELLPGPRGRDGLPQNLRFWKKRLEETGPQETFSVGLLYGPSGCGKSSLVKAGILPCLADHVSAIYLEATPHGTEIELRNQLRKRFANLPSDIGLVEALTRLRWRQGLCPSEKVVIVLDQFEQWLHARRRERNPELVAALRQCDGASVQCLVMVRDDFWMAVRHFMRKLEVRVVEEQNADAVDLFDIPHARKVLAAFGRAFGCLPEDPGKLAQDQGRFLDQAVAGLAQDGKVIPVRLSLFAEMVKNKPWTPATYKAVGSPEGIGVLFLEETFSAPGAPPEHRFHQQAARAVLKALLPGHATPIRGEIRSRQELLKAADYVGRPQEFEDLLRILDTELRLVTPTTAEQFPPGDDANSPTPARPAGQYYRLTHDYLVPAIRDWLTQKQRETNRGRAELRLADRTALWQARPEARYLPAWWEWADIFLFTRRKNWTLHERKMMAKASRYHGSRAAALAVTLAFLLLIGLGVRSHLRQKDKESYAHALVERLLDADVANVRGIIKEMESYRLWADSLLKEAHANAAADSRQKLYASMALLPADPGQADYLYDRLLDSNPDDFLVLRAVLRPQREPVLTKLWRVLADDQAGADQRFRAACALAEYEPEIAPWRHAAEFVARKLVTENPLRVDKWKDALQGKRDALLAPLASIFRDVKRSEVERNMAASLLADYASDRPDMLADLIKDADTARQYSDLFIKLRVDPVRATELMMQELTKPLAPDPKGDNEAAAKRQAQAAVALLQLGQGQLVEPLLRRSRDPRVRGWLIHRLSAFGTAATVLLRYLERVPADIEVQEALLLCLGGYSPKDFSSADRNTLLTRARDLYINASDSGVHGAAEWFLRQWQQDQWLKEIEGKWANDRPKREERLKAISADLTEGGNDTKPQWYVNRHGDTLVVFPRVKHFQMGSPPEEKDRDFNDETRRAVRIDRSFAIATKKVTVRQFNEFWLDQKKEKPKGEVVGKWSPDLDGPVLGITWYQAAWYCNWLSWREGAPKDQWCYPEPTEDGMVMPEAYLSRTGYRLPTEAEWEYACRAGTITRRYYGAADELLGHYAWHQMNSEDRAHRVGLLKPNGFGLFDMLGNTWDWCQNGWPDQDAGRPYSADDREDTQPIRDSCKRATRGGCFMSPPGEVRCASRNRLPPNYLTDPNGFRVARTYR
jgi:serine/threonine protein kinase/formylglycine-generating enzyme required for sulfatase activity